jgi:hypothetical protein
MQVRNWLRNTAPLLLLAWSILWLPGCKKKEGCTDPSSSNYDPDAKVDDGSCLYEASDFKVNVNHVVGTLPYSTGTVYTHADGRQYRLTMARFYFSHPSLNTASGHVHLQEYSHIVAGTSSYELGEVEPDAYISLEFNVGVDSFANHADPTAFSDDHALSASSPTFDHWSWNTGYFFLRIEGVADTSAAMTGTVDGPFEMHIGADDLLGSVTLSREMIIVSGQNYALNVKVDWAKALTGVDLRNATTHTMDNMPLAIQVMDNFVQTAITVE